MLWRWKIKGPPKNRWIWERLANQLHNWCPLCPEMFPSQACKTAMNFCALAIVGPSFADGDGIARTSLGSRQFQRPKFLWDRHAWWSIYRITLRIEQAGRLFRCSYASTVHPWHEAKLIQIDFVCLMCSNFRFYQSTRPHHSHYAIDSLDKGFWVHWAWAPWCCTRPTWPCWRISPASCRSREQRAFHGVPGFEVELSLRSTCWDPSPPT